MQPSITDWIMVAITCVYVGATIFICVFNGKAAKAANEQTEEVKRQFLSINRPIITVEIVYLKRAFWALRLSNHGALTAYNAKIKLDPLFIRSLPEETFRELLENDNGKVRTIGVNQYYDLFFASNEFRDVKNKPPIKGQIIYNGVNGLLYTEDFEIEVQNYAVFYSVNSDMDDLMKRYSEQNKELKMIRQTLQEIRTQFCKESTESKIENSIQN